MATTVKVPRRTRIRRQMKVCRYCKHSRSAHKTHDPTQPPPSLRCSRCKCPCYIHVSGKPDWLVAHENMQYWADLRAKRLRQSVAI
jgi:hypothetical protein